MKQQFLQIVCQLDVVVKAVVVTYVSYISVWCFQQPAFNGSYSFAGGQVRDVRVSASATGIIGWMLFICNNVTIDEIFI